MTPVSDFYFHTLSIPFFELFEVYIAILQNSVDSLQMCRKKQATKVTVKHGQKAAISCEIDRPDWFSTAFSVQQSVVLQI